MTLTIANLLLATSLHAIAKPVTTDPDWLPVMQDIATDEVNKLLFPDPLTMYASAPTWRVVVMSNDSGISWHNLSTDTTINTLYMGKNGQYDMYIGTPGGGMWQRIVDNPSEDWHFIHHSETEFVSTIAEDPHTDINNIYMGTAPNPYKPNSNGNILQCSGACDALDSYTHFTSTGLDKFVTGKISTRSIAFDSQSNLYTLIDDKGIYVLSKKTQIWSLLSNNLVAQNLLIDNHDQLYLQTLKGVYKSVDAGKNWEAINDGLTNLHVNELLLDSDQNLFAATQDGVFELMHDTTQWIRLRGLNQVDVLHIALNEWTETYSTSKTFYAITKTQIYQHRMFK